MEIRFVFDGLIWQPIETWFWVALYAVMFALAGSLVWPWIVRRLGLLVGVLRARFTSEVEVGPILRGLSADAMRRLTRVHQSRRKS